MVQRSVLRPMEKPTGKTTHRWPGDPNTRTRTHGETHIEEAALRAAPLCGFLYMGLSLGTGSCLWDARPAMCRFAYGFLPGSEHRALQPCVAFPIIGNRFQLLQIKSNNVPPVLFHRFPVSSNIHRSQCIVVNARIQARQNVIS